MSHPTGTSATPPPKLTPARCLRQWQTLATGPSRLAALLSLLDVAAAVGFAGALSAILGGLRLYGTGGAHLFGPVLILVASLCAKAALAYVIQKLNHRAARAIILKIRMDITGRLLRGQGLSSTHAVKLTSLFEDTEALGGYYARFLPARTLAAITPLILIAVVAVMSPLSALILMGTLLPFVALMALSGLTTSAQSRQQLDALSRLSSLFADRMRALPLILSFDNGPAQTAAVNRAAREVSERTLSVLKIAFTASGILEFFSALGVALVAVYCGFALLGLLPFPVAEVLDFKGGDAFTAAFFALALSPEVYAPMRRLSAAYHDQQTAVAATERLMQLTPRLSDAATAMPITAAPAIIFDQVVARFEDDPDYRIGPVSSEAAPGEVIAITGDTGSGKSTLLRRLLNPSEAFDGQILIDGAPLTAGMTIAPSIAWMSQHTPMLAGTIRDNLRLSNTALTDADMQAVLDITGVSAIIAARTDGLDHLLDERGSGLSGGERRRIGLARALLKPAPILILDEPTADLDAQAEVDILKALTWGFTGRTVVMATHSEALQALADKVVRL
ncbi:ATP-binding cassette domain-containing protein [Asticcacaulis sp. ZE23SCel15]|uniref:ABC transporter ATP-binding protein/permease n=1 Tax=Asticcacaulis sp. ZE23SCel15 TaxID=3059027 RepID=UPI00265D758A|nr:ATP-binding cassette domain-containing protein [Asticcacaulis sp. ZE23SCel15]WKL58826.1 ATP-binding cassette domain-containing protein [Asticcacaulis sp. ZE23SCel15]